MSTQILSPRGDAATASVPDVAALVRGRRGRARRRTLVAAILFSAVVGVFVVTLMVGNTFYTPDQVIRVILGQTVPGASFTIGELRLPRASLGLLSGLAFGMAGVTFQTMLRNPLASPDIIGISSGASAFAVVAIIGFSLSDAAVSAFALVGALATAGAIYLLSRRGAFTGTRLVLIGIGVAAMLDSVTTWMLTRAANWDLQTAMQWLTGSLNNASWERLLPLAATVVVVLPLMVANTRGLAVLRLGDDSAAGLGVRVERTRVLLIVGAVVMLAVATAASGPIAFVAFMAGPIAARLIGPGGSLLVPAGLVGALLVMLSDLLGQFAFDNRYPVGVITGVLGAPYLIYLLIRTNRSGGSL